LLVNHIEYKEQLKLYEEIHWGNYPWAEMHGPAVASIAVGKNVGVAPGSDLYFISCWMGENDKNGKFEYNLDYVSQSIDRIIEINSMLKKENKIRVISISLGINNKMKGYKNVIKAINRAKKVNITTLYVGSKDFLGLGRDPVSDPNVKESYEKGLFWKEYRIKSNNILIPMDSRCFASPTGENDYVFNRSGGMSWTVPYIAGVFALACQKNDAISFDEFWQKTIESSEALIINGENCGKIINIKKIFNYI
jgi:hypothetical protein